MEKTSSAQEKRFSADIEKIEKRVADMEKDHFKQINVGESVKLRFVFLSNVPCFECKFVNIKGCLNVIWNRNLGFMITLISF